jgi:phosphate starvation-inducible protein PhoH
LHVLPNGEKNFVIASSQFYQMLSHLGLSNGKAETKCVPKAILTATQEIVSAFLSGLFDANGTVEKRDGSIVFSSISEKLVNQVQIILLNFGIVACKSDKRGTYLGNPHFSFLLTISGKEAEKFDRLIGFRLERKKSRRILRKSNPNFDFVPNLKLHINAAVKTTILTRAEHKKFWDYRIERRRPSYEKLAELIEILQRKKNRSESLLHLQNILEKQLLFLEIRSITKSKARVFDLNVPKTHSFVANGFVNHNSFLAVAMAVQDLFQKKVSRIILTRPAVEAGEKLGFLPGDLQDKVDPYLRPLYDALFDLVDVEKVTKMLEKRIIEVAPLAFMRGRTLSDSFIILDEAQNTTGEQMKMFLTRIGFGSKAVVTGDITQIDLPRGQKSGLIEAQRILKTIEGIEFINFTEKDVVRHRLVQMIVKAYEEHTSQEKENERG